MLCARCKAEKPLSAYYKGQRSWCKECVKAYRKDRYHGMTPREKLEAAYAAKLKRVSVPTGS